MLELIAVLFMLFFLALFIGAGLLIVLIIIRVINVSGRPVEENVVQRWGAYLPGQKQAGEEYLTLCEQEFSKRKTNFSQERINFGLGKQAGPAVRIVFSKVYSTYITYEATGEDLSLHYVLYRKGGWFYAIPWVGLILYRLLNVIYVHEHNRLIGFASVTIDCAKEAAGTLMDKLDVDKSKRIKESSGQLGPL
ncbi:MAG: hypothetical protein IBX64_12790 [Actinobacteria bacterium]|nr:hypothetical protein [Actinomycetota bacterium]